MSTKKKTKAKAEVKVKEPVADAKVEIDNPKEVVEDNGNVEVPVSERKEMVVKEISDLVTYTGTKTIKAAPITKGEYLKYRGWENVDGDDLNEEIYLVEYEVDANSKPNHSNHKGYITMSPKHVFEKAYKASGTYMDRLKIERDDLGEKVSKLTVALEEKKVPKESRAILRNQLDVMEQYLNILNHRLKA